MTESTQLGKIVEFLYQTNFLDTLSKAGSPYNRGTHFLVEAICELAIVHQWNVEDAAKFYIEEVFDEGMGVKVTPLELEKSNFVASIKESFDLSNRNTIDKYSFALGFDVKTEVEQKYSKLEIP